MAAFLPVIKVVKPASGTGHWSHTVQNPNSTFFGTAAQTFEESFAYQKQATAHHSALTDEKTLNLPLRSPKSESFVGDEHETVKTPRTTDSHHSFAFSIDKGG